jgi:hypothetical protein
MAFNNGPRLVTQGLNLLVDAGDPTSYPGTGTTWRDVIGGQNGTITGSVSYSSAYYGGLVFSGPTASVIFPTSSANFGSGSFTVEIAFQPARIEGIHYLISKNSGSFPNWGVYLSGSGGSGKLFSFFNISSTVSCSVSSSTTFVTGSNYDVSVRVFPGSSGSGFYVDGVSIGGGLGNGGGSLTSTGSLLIGNIAPSSSQAFSGSLFATKIYSINSLTQPSQNYNAIASRLSKPSLIASLPAFELLVVGAGGGSANGPTGGGGGGGLVYSASFTPVIGTSIVIVGSGSVSSNGTNSVFGSVVALGGGAGGPGANGSSGGSGGGAGGYNPRTGGSGSAGQGFAGGNNIKPSNPTQAGAYNGSAAGGGAGGTGSDATADYIGAPGGLGRFIASFTSIGGSPAGWFAGGGGGGDLYVNSVNYIPNFYGGIGGGGTGSYVPNGFSAPSQDATTGSANTGGGAGGTGASKPGAAGGSGIVAIRYNGTPIAVGGEITQSAGFTYHVFRTTGTSSFTIF